MAPKHFLPHYQHSKPQPSSLPILFYKPPHHNHFTKQGMRSTHALLNSHLPLTSLSHIQHGAMWSLRLLIEYQQTFNLLTKTFDHSNYMPDWLSFSSTTFSYAKIYVTDFCSVHLINCTISSDTTFVYHHQPFKCKWSWTWTYFLLKRWMTQNKLTTNSITFTNILKDCIMKLWMVTNLTRWFIEASFLFPRYL